MFLFDANSEAVIQLFVSGSKVVLAQLPV